jgi:5-methyltetrahydropteroyltriglutamate--homocysteine methyltransferase
MTYPAHLLPTTVVGSYPQPDWLVDRSALHAHGVPRTHAHDIWRIPDQWLEAAQDDATILAIRDMERAGIDIVTDGEIRRESYSNRFALALEGVDADQPGEIRSTGRVTAVPRVTGRIRRIAPVEVRDAEFLVRNTDRPTKITLPGPFTLSQQAQNAFYADEAELAMDYAVAVNAELRDLKAAGVDVVQLDEPWVRTAPDKATQWGIAAINRALEGIEGPTIVHLCFGYAAVVVHEKPTAYGFLPQLADCAARQISIEAAQPRLDLGVLRDLSNKTILLGVLDLGSTDVETDETIAARIRAGLQYVSPDRLVPAPDCGMKYLPRAAAFGKLQALAAGAAIVRRELG